MKAKSFIFGLILFAFANVVSAAENEEMDKQLAAAKTLEDLLKLVQQNKISQSRESQSRIAKFNRQKNQQQSLLNRAKQELNAEKAKEERLKATYNANEKKLTELTEELRIKSGSLGEIVGEVRRNADDMASKIRTSIISAQYPGRHLTLNKLAQTETLPESDEIRGLWLEMLNEMTEQSKIVRFPQQIINSQGRQETRNIVRVGPFNLISDGEYLVYEDKEGDIRQLSRQPDLYKGLVLPFIQASNGYQPLALDPSRGAILEREVERQSWEERVKSHAGPVGMAIIGVLIIGLVIVLERTMALSALRGKIKRQAKSSVPGNNPLGRVMAVYLANKDSDVENLELKLDEAVLKETPNIEKRVTIIKVFAAIAPLMGLLGTVIGMIETFQSITLYGTSDPQLMADGISQALITTVLGIVAALPLILSHSVVAGMSKNLVHILEQQSTGLIAQHQEAEA